MITHDQVAELREGDVVELTHRDWLDGTVLRGPLCARSGALHLGNFAVRYDDGAPLGFIYREGHNPWHLTVVSRAPRPLYVNHPRTEPVTGDVVTLDHTDLTWFYDGDTWRGLRYGGGEHPITGGMPTPLRLLVDGETGQVVP